MEDQAFASGGHGRRWQTGCASHHAAAQPAPSEETLSHRWNLKNQIPRTKKEDLGFGSWNSLLYGDHNVNPQFGIIFALVFLVAADTPKDDAIKKEADMLQGTWRVVSAQ